MTEPLLPVAAQSHQQLRLRNEPPQKPKLVFLHIDGVSDLRTQTCPQCGENPAGPPVKRVLQYVPPWVYLGLAMNVVVLLILYFAGRKRVDAVFRLCRDCAAQERQARVWRSLSVGGVLVLPVLGAIVGTALGDINMTLAGVGTGLVASLAGLVAAHTKTKHVVIETKAIDKNAGTVTLLAGPSWERVLHEEARDALATTPR